MSHESHLVELERRHDELELAINDAMSHPGADALEITELKRRKLQLKDEISRLQKTETLH